MKRLLKRLRAFEPLNRAATATVRASMRASGREWAWAVDHLHRVGEVRSTLPNGRILQLWSRGDDWVSNQVFWRGWDGYETETARIFFTLAREARCTIDVGAYVGFFTLLAGHANPGGHVHAFEPHPANHARLVSNVAANGLANVTAWNVAAGEHAGEATLFHGPGLPTSNSLAEEFRNEHPGLLSTNVPVIRLDEALPDQDRGRVDLVKVDTEGTEPDVLQGCRGILDASRPFVVAEVLSGSRTGPRLEDLLRPLGYTYFHLGPAGLEPRERIAGVPGYLNYLFAAREVPRHFFPARR